VENSTKSHADLPPGMYEIEVVCRPGYVLAKYEISPDKPGLHSSGMGQQVGPILNLKPGDRITIQVAVEKALVLVRKEPGWVQLFNGKDLTGWVPLYDKQKYATAPWDIVEPVLVLKGGKDQPTGYLRTVKHYREFHLRFDYKHTSFAPQQTVNNSHIYWGMQGPDDPSTMGWTLTPAGLAEPKRADVGGGLELSIVTMQPVGTVFWGKKGINKNVPWENVTGGETPADKWNRAEILSKSGELEFRLNGVSKIIKSYQPIQGHLALFGSEQGLHLRNIEIKELAPGTPSAGDSGLDFDGKAAHVEIPSLFTDDKQPLTVEGYCRPKSISKKGQCLVLMSGPGALFLNIGGDPPFVTTGAFLGDQAHGQHIEVGQLGNMPRRFHFAAVWDGKEYRLYVDGREVGKAYGTGMQARLTHGTFLGVDPGDLKRTRFHGLLRELRFSNVARYNKDFIPETRFKADKGTLALYHCDEGQGDKLTDSSGNGHHGNIVSAKWVVTSYKDDKEDCKAAGSPNRPTSQPLLTEKFLQDIRDHGPAAEADNVKALPRGKHVDCTGAKAHWC
jgi:hypothetical protein